jgi:integrase
MKKKLLKLLVAALTDEPKKKKPKKDKPPKPEKAEAVEGLTLSQWLVTHRKILAERGYHAQTMRNRGASLKKIDELLGSRPLREIKPHEITTALKTLSPHCAVRVLGELRDVYVEAIANGEADTSPAAHVKPPPAPGLRKRLKLETWQAMLTLAKAGPQRWVPAMLLLALATGQRRADLAKMRFDDVFDGHLRVEQQKKAGKPVGARVAIPLTLRLEATGMTLGDVINYCKTIGKPGDTLLRQANGRPIEMSSLSARFHEHIVAVCGQDAYARFEWPSLHEVRSLSARTYVAEGLEKAVVQKLLGHKDEEMTDIYLNERDLAVGRWEHVQAPAAVNSEALSMEECL